MASWTRDDVRTLAPEFVATDDATIDRYIGWAASEVDEAVHGGRAVRAGALLTAHLLTILPPVVTTDTNSGSQASGPVVRERVGDVEVQYADYSNSGNASDFNAALTTSVYGREYLRLVRLAAAGPWVI